MQTLCLEQARKNVSSQGGQAGRCTVDGPRPGADLLLGVTAKIEASLNPIANFCHAVMDALALAVCLLLKLVYGFRIQRHFGYLPAEKIHRRV